MDIESEEEIEWRKKEEKYSKLKLQNIFNFFFSLIFNSFN
jgi:hypothetical protein